MRRALALTLLLAGPAAAQVKGEPPPSVADLAYESRVKAAQASAQAFQGPFDGGWTVTDAKGRALYVLQLADNGRDPVGGAWREAGGTDATRQRGMVDAMAVKNGVLTLSFGGRTATLKPAGKAWRGQVVEVGKSRKIAMTRRAP